MWLTPRSIALRSAAIERFRSLGVPRSKTPVPVRRIAPNPIRFTVRSPSAQVPAALAAGSPAVTERSPRSAATARRARDGQDPADDEEREHEERHPDDQELSPSGHRWIVTDARPAASSTARASRAARAV